MKRVFNNSELAHIWAQQSQAEGNSPNFNMFFEGKSIYSYDTSFEIARFITEDLVLFNSASYSISTAKHQIQTRQATSHLKTFTVPSMSNHATNVNYYIDMIKGLSGKQVRSRKYDYSGEIQKFKTKLTEYAKFFKFRLLKSHRNVLHAEISEIGDRVIKIEKQKTAKQKRKLQSDMRLWTGDKKLKFSTSECYLRINGDQVQTSQRANVPLKEAKILFYRMQAGKDIKGFKIGYYTVISMNEDLKIGCHNISRKEIKRFAEMNNW